MANAGTIAVNLIARTEAFVKGMDASKRRITALEKATKATMRTVRVYGAIALAAAVGGISVLTKKSLENIDAIAKQSDRLGVSTEFLSAFGHAATIAGASQETLSKGIQYMLKNIGEANMGLKSYQDAFTEIGLSYETLNRVSPEEAFLMIAKRLRDVDSAATKTSVAMRIFGRSGSSLLNMMQGDLDGVIDRAKELGITFDRNMAARVEQANDAITRMKSAWTGIGNTIAISVAPYIEAIANRITTMTTGKNSLEDMQKRVQNIAIAATYLMDAFNGVRMVVNTIAAFWQKIISSVLKGIEKLAALGEKVNRKLSFIPGMKTAAFTAGQVRSIAGELSSDFSDASSNNWQQAKDQFMGLGKQREELKSFFEDVAMQTANTATAQAMGVVDAVADEQDKVSKKYSGSAELFSSQNINLSGLRDNQKQDGIEDKLDEMLRIQRKAFA